MSPGHPLAPGSGGSAHLQLHSSTLAAKPHIFLIPLVMSVQPLFLAISTRAAVSTSLCPKADPSLGIETPHPPKNPLCLEENPSRAGAWQGWGEPCTPVRALPPLAAPGGTGAVGCLLMDCQCWEQDLSPQMQNELLLLC